MLHKSLINRKLYLEEDTEDLFASSSSATEGLELWVTSIFLGKDCVTSVPITSLLPSGGMGTGKISFIVGGLTDWRISEGDGGDVGEGEGGDVGEGGEMESILEIPGLGMG